MRMHRFPSLYLPRGVFAIACLLPAMVFAANGMQSSDGSTSSASPVAHPVAPSYASDPSFGQMSFERFGTPEADGRPGEYYFKLAVQAFQKQQYSYAIDMYKVAASWAYKPAEYNLGVMYFKGQGVPVDRPLGTAWMVLAAERNTPHYDQVRDLMVTLLSNNEFSKADALYGELKPTYGDATALHKAEVRWAQVRAAMTGSRVGSSASPLRVGALNGGRVMSSHSTSPALRHMDTSAWEYFSGEDMDGAVAYEQFRQSINPYDVKFQNNPVGTISIGPLQPLKTKPYQSRSTNLDDSARHND